MERKKYDLNLIRIMSIFGATTNAQLKDAIDSDELLLFIVEENQIGKAVGKQGINVRKLEHAFNRKIKIVEFNADLKRFIENFVYPLSVREIREENKIVTIIGQDRKTNGLLIGRDAKNLNFLKDVVRRYFDVENIRVST
ncbi:MAG: NusA-like transcription termination signal-binding factor [Nanoarchaeota archaeon]|nr:NusA-like transcription termination signal-binding factor [Nanoarchaeota archaeon]